MSHEEGSDPAAVAYDTVNAASSRKLDIGIIDTAGRLHTKTNLMEELKKIKRSICKLIPENQLSVLIVLVPSCLIPLEISPTNPSHLSTIFLSGLKKLFFKINFSFQLL